MEWRLSSIYYNEHNRKMRFIIIYGKTEYIMQMNEIPIFLQSCGLNISGKSLFTNFACR